MLSILIFQTHVHSIPHIKILLSSCGRESGAGIISLEWKRQDKKLKRDYLSKSTAWESIDQTNYINPESIIYTIWKLFNCQPIASPCTLHVVIWCNRRKESYFQGLRWGNEWFLNKNHINQMMLRPTAWQLAICSPETKSIWLSFILSPHDPLLLCTGEKDSWNPSMRYVTFLLIFCPSD